MITTTPLIVKMKKVFITGISGQDGSNLAEYLLSLGYEVHGTIRRNSLSAAQDKRIAHLDGKIRTYYGDLSDVGGIEKLLKDIQPDEIYNLAAMSHVKISWDVPAYTLQTNGLGVLSMLEAYKNNCPDAKFYQASSSECFGLSVDDDKMQRETTPMNPTSVYGCSKVLGYNLVRHYRRAYGLHAVNGILFNHSGARRGENFVEMKICKAAVEIKIGMLNKLELGNMDSYRDFGSSKDYVRAMHMIVNHHTADDFVVATGKTYSVRNICEMAFRSLGLDYKNYVVQNPKYLRPEELPYLCGDGSKIKSVLGWKPEHTFQDVVNEMISYWMDVYRK